jgi:hypothetical protein
MCSISESASTNSKKGLLCARSFGGSPIDQSSSEAQGDSRETRSRLSFGRAFLFSHRKEFLQNFGVDQKWTVSHEDAAVA